MPQPSSSSPKPNFYQILGYCSPGDELDEDDIITAIQFEKRGDYLAIGDQGGRVVIFERDYRKIEPSCPRKFLEGLDFAPAQRPKFRYKSEFQSHEPEIDYFDNVEAHFKNEQVPKRIKKLSWCIAQNGLLLLLSSNDKTIKLWTIKECKTKKLEHGPHRFYSSENALVHKSYMSGQETLIKNLSREDPYQDINYVDDEIVGTGKTFHAKCQKVYVHARSFNIKSISNNSDAETFISADALTINLWNLEVSDRNFNIINLEPSDMEPYPSEMITSAVFHPVHCNLLAYGSSHGRIRVYDLRQAARCDRSVISFDDRSVFPMKSIFDLMASRISDVKFLVDGGVGGQQLISRDYLNMKLWDMRMDSRPVETFRIQEHLRHRLKDLYFEEHIFDQFDCSCSRDGLSFATGCYGNRLKIFSTGNGSVEDLKLDIIGDLNSYRISVLPEDTVSRSPIKSNTKPGFEQGGGMNDDELDCKLSYVAWHPTSNLVAAAIQSSLILYPT